MQVHIDPRQIKSGSFFYATQQHHIQQAISNGATRIITTNIFKKARQYRQKLNCPIIAVTGIIGKTTVKNLLFQILSLSSKTVVSPGNFNNLLGNALTLFQADSTTQFILLEMNTDNPSELRKMLAMAQPTHIIITSTGYQPLKRTTAKLYRLIFKAIERKNNSVKNPFFFMNSASLFDDFPYKIFPFAGDTRIEQNLNIAYLLSNVLGIKEEHIRQGISHFQRRFQKQNVIQHQGILFILGASQITPETILYSLEYLRSLGPRKILICNQFLSTFYPNPKLFLELIHQSINSDVSFIMSWDPVQYDVSDALIPIYPFQDPNQFMEAVKTELKKGDIAYLLDNQLLPKSKIMNYIIKG